MPNRRGVGLRVIETPTVEHHDAIRGLLRDYEASLSVSLDFQNFASELADFPTGYEPPEGRVVIAWDEDRSKILGVICMRRLSEECCEMKRLFVCPEARGRGVGRLLVEAIIAAGREAGYSRMRLDTLAEMGAAAALYRSLGFRHIENYNGNPTPGALFFERDLT